MKSHLARAAVAALIGFSAIGPAHALLQTMTGLYVFGDSLSDGGNYNGPSLGPPGPYVPFPPPPYAGGRYSNGPTAVEYLWNAYNPGDTTFKPSNYGGTNYALGGATTGTTSFNSINPNVPGAIQPYFTGQGGMTNQVNQFATSCAGCFNPASSLFVVWGFPNDVFLNVGLGGPVPPATLIANGINNIVNSILTLSAEGALQFLIPNMPDLGSVPSFAGGPAAASLTALTQAFNANLAATLTALDMAIPAQIMQFDTFSALAALQANPAAYGLTNATDACLDFAATCDPDRWLFWDGAHPTTAGHRLLGQQFANVVPEPGAFWLVATALLLAGIARRPRRRARLQ